MHAGNADAIVTEEVKAEDPRGSRLLISRGWSFSRSRSFSVWCYWQKSEFLGFCIFYAEFERAFLVVVCGQVYPRAPFARYVVLPGGRNGKVLSYE